MNQTRFPFTAFFIITTLVFSSCIPARRNADEERYILDTLFFTGSSSALYPPAFQETIKKTPGYQKYRSTQNPDSVRTYLIQGEKEAKAILHMK